MKKPIIGFISLGCPKNQIDTEVMLRELVDAGYDITPEDIEADIIIVNTCGFIESAKQEAIDNILDVAWLKKHRKLKGIICCGCLAERYREQIFEELPEVDAVVGTGSIHNIVKAVEAVSKGEKYLSCEPNEELVLGGERVVTTPDYTAYIKIAEGCDNRCSYCAIPNIRGKFRSRKIEDIVEEAKSLEELGVKELVIVAQDTSRYGLDIYGEYSLAKLIRELTKATTIPWFRLLYCYPDKITDELVKEIATNDRVVKYIDLPIQHISDNMLKAMNRHGDGKCVRDTVKRLREQVPGIVIRTTAIVGFPGETEEDFTELCEYIKEAKFDRFGAFPYSREEDTPAFDLPDQIDEQVKQDRYDEIMALQLDIHEENNQKKIGKTVKVLCEGFDPVAETFFGRSEADAPEIDGKVYFSSKRKPKEGEFVTVKITDAIDYDLYGEMI
ncbi:MAG: 30S ribosomal protein S12 methylthiotransferase RimO [Ruminococcaceae bacterium]|nr:30S ribosomal protein S12 methylthiotransferase RimO [Oscillospiraceae bacterium]MBO5040994.1 30S ribosomal protein S12 methylthiotransferase RimO [Clostridia bacterium]